MKSKPKSKPRSKYDFHFEAAGALPVFIYTVLYALMLRLASVSVDVRSSNSPSSLSSICSTVVEDAVERDAALTTL